LTTFLLIALSTPPCESQQSTSDTGAPEVKLTHAAGKWILTGKGNVVEIDERNLAVNVQSGPVTWKMVPSSSEDMLVARASDEFRLRLADASDIKITPYETGFKTGIKIVVTGFRKPGARPADSPVDLSLVLTMCLQGPDDELVSEATAIEHGAVVKELNWPKEMNGLEVDYTVISSDDGTLLPRDWPRNYHPIHRTAGDTSIIQSHLIESWSMSWWGFEKGDSAMIVIVETPDDAAYTFSHPAGGPTKMGPSWRAQLGRFAYTRRIRMVFFPKGNYVTMAKRYRAYVKDSGLYVSLKDKIAQRPIVSSLIGVPFTGASVLRNVNPKSTTYDSQHPEKNLRLRTFAQNVERMRKLKAQGFTRLNISMSGWLKEGYDRQTPDALPPAKQAGGWEGMKAFFDACKDLDYTCWLHDQYRDYYIDAPSWNPEFAVHEEDSTSRPTAFPGTRFKHDWKDGSVPFMNYWDGGTQGYLNNGFMLGHLMKNYRAMFDHGIHPRGSYQDVFGYIPPDQDFNPEHPSTRTDSMNARAAVFNWTKNNLGIVGTEDGSDWVIPYVDYVTSRFNRGANTGTDPDHQDAIRVPLYELVYHDAVVTTNEADDPRSFLHGNAPQMGWGDSDQDVKVDQVRRMAALHARVGSLEMTNHEFLNKDRNQERTTFADGTTVTVDWRNNSIKIDPDVGVANR